MKPLITFPLTVIIVLFSACEDFNKPLVPFIAESLATVVVQDCNTNDPCCKNSCVKHRGEWAILPGKTTTITVELFNYFEFPLGLALEGYGGEYITDWYTSDDNRYFTFSVEPSASGDLIDLTLIIKTLNEDTSLRREMPSYKLPPMRARYLNNELETLFVNYVNNIDIPVTNDIIPIPNIATTAIYTNDTQPDIDINFTLPSGVLSTCVVSSDKASSKINASGKMPLESGTNKIKFDVTADCGRLNTYTLTVNKGVDPAYGIWLSATGTHNFSPTPATYSPVASRTPLNVTIGNIGHQPTGNITVNLSGNDKDSFTLSTTSVVSIAAGGTITNAFNVRPNTGLNARTEPYTATVTVSGGNGITASFNVSFTVNKANPIVMWPSNVRALVNQTYSNGFPYASGGSASFADSSVSGTFTWNATRFTASGRYNVTVTFTPENTINYNTLSQAGTVRAIPSNAIYRVYEGKAKSISGAVTDLNNKALDIQRVPGTSTGSDSDDYGDLNDGTTRFGYSNPYTIFLGYTTISNLFEDPITNILGFTGSNPPLTRNVSGITYTRFVADSNDDAGGDTVSFYYTTDENAGNPVIDMFVKVGGTTTESPYSSQSGWTRVNQDANSGTGGSTPNIFIWIRR